MNIQTGNLADDPSYVEALARGLSVIQAFGRDREQLTLAEAAKITGLSRATVRRALFTLHALGFVTANGRHFRLTPAILSLGYAYLASTPLPGIVQPALERVSEETHESSSACVLDGVEIVYVARSAQRRIMSVGLAVGSRLPAFCTSMGRVLLAAEPPLRRRELLARSRLAALTPATVTDPERLLELLDEVGRQGYALVDQELETGLRSIAVPVLSSSGQTVAAMNVSVQAGRVSREAMVKTLLPTLRAAAEGLRPALPG